jgi:hypothetical protein
LSLIDFIEKLQNKPKKIRIRIFIGAVVFSAIIVFTAFVFSIGYSLRDYNNDDELSKMKKELNYEKLPSIMSSIKSSILEIFNTPDDIKDGTIDRNFYEEVIKDQEGKKLPEINQTKEN